MFVFNYCSGRCGGGGGAGGEGAVGGRLLMARERKEGESEMVGWGGEGKEGRKEGNRK